MLNGFGDMCEKLLSDPKCSIFRNGGHVFDGSEIPTSILCRIKQGPFMQSLVPISQVVSEEKICEKKITSKIAKKKVEKGL